MSNYAQAFIDYLVYFHAERDFFECHEVLEEFWKEHPQDPLAKAYVGLIQVAVSMYHQRRSNLIGAEKMLRIAINNLSDGDTARLGIDSAAFRRSLEDRLTLLGEPEFHYEDMNIPIADPLLLESCLNRCAAKKLSWPCSSDLSDTYLINKHTLRDRSEVIAERTRKFHLKNAAKKV